jgi:preprotein translocase SecE subunit
VARDRKRAKQRRERRAQGARSSTAASKPGRADVPGALDHASSDVDEFDAALVRGAGGVTATPEAESATTPEAETTAPETEVPGESTDGSEDALQAPGGPGGGSGDRGGDGAGGDGSGGDHERPSGAPLRGGNRALAFVRASWAELQRVQWPDRRQVTQATAVVIGFVAIAGAYLGLADFVAKEIVEFVL